MAKWEPRVNAVTRIITHTTHEECLILWEISHRLFEEAKHETSSKVRRIKESEAMKFEGIREKLIAARELATGEELSYTKDGDVRVRQHVQIPRPPKV
jgi:hypothetical protein